MNSIRTSCWLAVTVLGAVTLYLAVQYTFASGAASKTAVAEAPGQDTEPTASKVPEGAGYELTELTVGLGGFRMPCLDCHKYLGPALKDPLLRGTGPHEQVVLEHGDNNRCFNCHHPSAEKYGSFVDHDGSVIPLKNVEKLCGKCHGPHYRDWKSGSHGLRTGYWDPDLGPQVTHGCISCHDPHQPYFKPIPTLPGPRSLRGELLPDHPCRGGH